MQIEAAGARASAVAESTPPEPDPKAPSEEGGSRFGPAVKVELSSAALKEAQAGATEAQQAGAASREAILEGQSPAAQAYRASSLL